ncbi:MAG: DNA recombination protein RmuC [Bacteroidota bacterium]|nr:DNA recombination protein RmuC [Bacteroidota bacterium]
MEFLFIAVGCVFGFVIAFLFFKSKQFEGSDTSALDNKIIALDKEKLVLQINMVNSEKENQRITNELKNTKEELSAELNSEREKYLKDINIEKDKLSKAESRLAKAEQVFQSQEEKFTTLKSELENVHKKYTTEFENIANKILDEKTQKFTDQNKNNLEIILNPLKEKIKDFESKVEKAYKAESDERITLKAEIKNLVDLNKQVSEDANNLAKALKGDNKKQGNWGEVILEKVLERSGLVKGQEYLTQFSTNNSEGSRIQPDAVIKLPDDKHVIVDAKVSLIAYEACVNATTDEERERFTKEHLLSVRNHVKLLSGKEYQSSADFNTPDFVLLFIPIESSFSIAVQADQELFSYAWDRKIVIVSPSTLLATLRTIASLWKQERQTKNVMEIARQGGELYDKFVGFLEDMQKIEKGIEASGKAYQDAINKLNTGSGNLIRRIENIKKLGAKTNKEKQIPSKFLDNDAPSQLFMEGTES